MGDDTDVYLRPAQVGLAGLAVWVLGVLMSLPAVFSEPFPALLWQLLYFTLPFGVLGLRIKFLFRRDSLPAAVFVRRVYGTALALLFLVLTYFGVVYVKYAYHPLFELVVHLMPLMATLLLPLVYVLGVGIGTLEFFAHGDK